MVDKVFYDFSGSIKPNHGLSFYLLLQKLLYTAIKSANTLTPNETWGTSDRPIINGKLQGSAPKYEEVYTEDIRPIIENSSDKEIVIHHDLDSNLKAFGKQFWQLVVDKHPNSHNLLIESSLDIENVKYRDRYLFNPLSVGLTLDLVKALKLQVGNDRWKVDEVSIVTSSKRYDNSRPGNKIYSDWVDCDDRDYVLEKVFDKVGIGADLTIPNRRSIQHSRVFEIEFSNNKVLSVRLDQGVGYWRVARSRRSSRIRKDEFEFSYVDSGEAGLDQEAEQVIQANPKIKGSQTPTEIFVKVR